MHHEMAPTWSIAIKKDKDLNKGKQRSNRVIHEKWLVALRKWNSTPDQKIRQRINYFVPL